jgi:hypothetical protein
MVKPPLGELTDVAECPLPAPTAQGECDVLLRADDIVHDDDAPVQAQIMRKAFRGSEFLYTLRLASGETVLAHVPSHHNHTVGEWIGIRAEVDHVVTFNRACPPGKGGMCELPCAAACSEPCGDPARATASMRSHWFAARPPARLRPWAPPTERHRSRLAGVSQAFFLVFGIFPAQAGRSLLSILLAQGAWTVAHARAGHRSWRASQAQVRRSRPCGALRARRSCTTASMPGARRVRQMEPNRVSSPM